MGEHDGSRNQEKCMSQSHHYQRVHTCEQACNQERKGKPKQRNGPKTADTPELWLYPDTVGPALFALQAERRTGPRWTVGSLIAQLSEQVGMYRLDRRDTGTHRRGLSWSRRMKELKSHTQEVKS